jgi:hypothetical protein
MCRCHMRKTATGSVLRTLQCSIMSHSLLAERLLAPQQIALPLVLLAGAWR